MSDKPDSVIAFDLGGTNNKMWRDDKETALVSETLLSKADERTVLDFLKKWIAADGQAQAVGIAIACTLVPESGERKILETGTKFGRLTEGKHRGVIRAMQEAWEDELNVKVFILNDGEAASMDVSALLRSGYPEKNYKNALVITLGTSIGAGFIFNGKPYLGPYTSRASHIILEPDGDWCIDEAHKGCWKSIAGDRARNELALKMGFQDPLDEKKSIPTKDIAEKAANGSKRARLYFTLYAESVARGIASVINSVPVECVVVAGGVANAGELLMSPLRARLMRGDLLDADLAPLIDIMQIASFSVARGAQLYAIEQYGRHTSL